MTNTARKFRRLSWHDPQAWDANGILKDGVTVSVPTYLVDAGAKMHEVHDAAQAVRSGKYNRPGWRPPLHQDAAALDARADAYQQYEERLTSAYLDARGDDPETGFGSSGSLDLQLGDVCTVKGSSDIGPQGSRGHIVVGPDGELCCKADHLRAGGSSDPRDAAMTRDARAALYRQYDEDISRQWAAPNAEAARRVAETASHTPPRPAPTINTYKVTLHRRGDDDDETADIYERVQAGSSGAAVGEAMKRNPGYEATEVETVDAMRRDSRSSHRQTMDQLYASYAEEVSGAWRRG